MKYKKIKFQVQNCVCKAHVWILYGNWVKDAEFTEETASKNVFSLKNEV